MWAQLNQLLKVVSSLAERNASQVSLSVEVMLEQLEKLESVPLSPIGKGCKTSKATVDFADLLGETVLDKCSAMWEALQKLEQVERTEHTLGTALSDKISIIHKLCIQAGHSDEFKYEFTHTPRATSVEADGKNIAHLQQHLRESRAFHESHNAVQPEKKVKNS